LNTYPSFEEFFETGSANKPFPYQKRLAEMKKPPSLIRIPTGSGKTLAAVASWLWRHLSSDNNSSLSTPRKLVYCLPMRVLVNQTFQEIYDFLDRLKLIEEFPVYKLIGGEINEEWLLYPERKCVIVGTQDMLLSRALNRGYSQSRFAWPRSFGLLNNDCQWIFDEVQLMSTSISTSAQLHGFRDYFGTVLPCQSTWMSATLSEQWLQSPDFSLEENEMFVLDSDDLAVPQLEKRVFARKKIEKFGLEGDAKNRDKELASFVLDNHVPGKQTLVVLNTVKRATSLYEEIKKAQRKRNGDSAPELMLIHSRFRPYERMALEKRIAQKSLPPEGRIIVSTQVVEAGVNITSSLLVTELAPWSSIVQRLGRNNRFGEEISSQACWIDLEEKDYPPYNQSEMDATREIMESMTGREITPHSLIDKRLSVESQQVYFVPRKKDLFELFDTTPDLFGFDTDVSRFIREGDFLDAYVFWRDFEENPPEDRLYLREELCPVPYNEVREQMSKSKDARTVWYFDHIDGRWRRASADNVFPGAVLMLKAKDGGYSKEKGWDPASKSAVEVITGEILTEPSEEILESEESDDLSHLEYARWVSLEDHASDVESEIEEILKALEWDALSWENKTHARTVLKYAALLHDIGKSSQIFQEALVNACDPKPPETTTLWAKGPGKGRLSYRRKYFRHELASTLRILSDANPGFLPEFTDEELSLLAYLIAAHHGKVRTAISPMPSEMPPGDERRYALGLIEGDELPEIVIGSMRIPSIPLSLGCMEMGNSGTRSWSERVLTLCHSKEYGPFRLAYFEALVRAADIRASIKERGELNER